MAVKLATVGSILQPFVDQPDDISPTRYQILQTSTSGATAGLLPLFGSATSSDDMILFSCHITVTTQTAASVISLMHGEMTVGATKAGQLLSGYNFGSIGFHGCTTTTHTTYLNITGATSTVHVIAVGGRKL